MGLSFNFNELIDIIIEIFYKTVKFPFKYWNLLPEYVRAIVFGLVIAFAVFMTWLTWKARNEWRYRY